MGNKTHTKIPLEFVHEFVDLQDGVYGGRLPPSFLHEQVKQFRHGYPLEFRNALASVSTLIKQIRYYGASQFTDPSRSPVSFEIEQKGIRRRMPLPHIGHRNLFYDMYIAQESNPSKFEEFLSLINVDGLGLVDNLTFIEQQVSSLSYDVKIGGKIVKKNQAKMLVIPQFMIGKNVLSPSQLSEGTFKTIALLFRLVTQQSSMLLIEEPEVCVHHGLLTSIVEIIRDYAEHTQIVMTTHSETVLDHVKPEHVFSVGNFGRRGTSVDSIRSSMSKQELNALREYLSFEGSLGEYWRSSGFDYDG